MTGAEGNPFREIPGLPASEFAASEAREGLLDSGVQEAQLLSSDFSLDEIERKTAEGDLNRGERFRNNFESIAIGALWVAALLLLGLGFTWFWHLLLPASWHWLTINQIDNLQNVVTGAVLSGIATGHIKRRLNQ